MKTGETATVIGQTAVKISKTGSYTIQASTNYYGQCYFRSTQFCSVNTRKSLSSKLFGRKITALLRPDLTLGKVSEEELVVCTKQRNLLANQIKLRRFKPEIAKSSASTRRFNIALSGCRESKVRKLFFAMWAYF